MTEPSYEVAIIGAGPGGIAAAHLLRNKGITNFVILERGNDFGGTWRDNHYPGLAVDIPTLWYQLSFAPNPDWTRLFAPGPELHRYLCDTARRLGLYNHLQGNTEVLQQKWDDTAGIWRLAIKDQPAVTARFVISSVGGYVNAKTATDIDGVDDFVGTILRPNAWDDGYDTRGKRIAVIGTGSSGVQIAAALSAGAENLDVFQRTPAWVLPKIDFDIPPLLRRMFRLPGVIGGVNILGRLAMDAFLVAPVVHLLPRLPSRLLTRIMPLYDGWCRTLYRILLRIVVDDPATRQALVPRYGILAKRPVISSRFLPALNNPTTNLITTPIERITRTGIRTVDGVEHPADLIVLATGYELWTDPETYRPATILGSNGFDLASTTAPTGCAAMPAPRIRGCPTVGRSSGRWASSASPGPTSSRPWRHTPCASSMRPAAAKPRSSKSARTPSTGGTPECDGTAKPSTSTSPPAAPVCAPTSLTRSRKPSTTDLKRSPAHGDSAADRRCRTTSSPDGACITSAPLPKELPA